MFLQEEYFSRHGITGVPIVNHVGNGSLLLRSNDSPFNWMVLAIRWEDPHNHPGKYHINFFQPIHNSYRNGRFFIKTLEKDIQIEWDRFQDYILGWSKGSKSTPIVGEVEVVLATWEVFTYCIDDWLAEEADTTLRKLHYASVDLDLTLQERYCGYQDALQYLGEHYPPMFRAFKDDMKSYLRNYCHWLGELVHSA